MLDKAVVVALEAEMLILDGGMSRELQRVGAPFRQPEWSALALIEAPEKVLQVHAEFARAGADVLTTNSYAIVPFHIGEERFQIEGLRLAQLAGELARQAADAYIPSAGRDPVKIAGSLPPIFGSYRPDLFDAGRAGPYLDVLIEGLSPSVDLWLGETLSSIAEAKAVTSALEDDQRPVWISFTLRDDDSALDVEPCLRSGESVLDAATWAIAVGAGALLFNCSRPEVMEPAVTQAAAVFRNKGSAIPIGVYANAFAPPPADTTVAANEGLSEVRRDLGPTSYARIAQRWRNAGASMVGGCCGIGTEHIHELARGLLCERTP